MNEKEYESKLIKYCFMSACVMAVISLGILVMRNVLFGLPQSIFMNATADILGIALNAVFMMGCLREPGYNTKRNTLFVQLLLSECMAWFADCGTWSVDGIDIPVMVVLAYFFNSIYYICSIWIIRMFYMYVIEILNVEEKREKIALIISGLAIGVLAVSLIANLKFGFLFTIIDGSYVRGPMVYLVFGFAEFLMALTLLLLKGRKIDRVEERAILIFIVLPLAGIVLQAAFPDCAFVAISAILSTAIMYVNAHNREVHLYEKSIAEQKALESAMMLSQIRPHFLYNTLTSIACLCRMDPEKAESATLAFSKYLRVNIDILSNDKPIPFDKEIEHVKNYLSIELIRFADTLKVEYDLAATNFNVPALSVQPLAENAVKYGICGKEDGGTLKISSRELSDHFEIEIADDGIGFDAKDDVNYSDNHVGVRNVRRRVELLCGGTLSIESAVGIGTKAVISIPKGDEKG